MRPPPPPPPPPPPLPRGQAPPFRASPPLPRGFAPPLAPLQPRGFAPWPFPHSLAPRHAPMMLVPRPVAPAFRPPLPPPRPPLDPDAAWLEQFKQSHLAAASAASQDLSAREPPLRRLSNMAARARPQIRQLRSLATEVLEIDAQIQELESGGEGVDAREDLPVTLARLKAQRETKLSSCERIRAELEAMNASTLFVPPEQLPKLRAFMKRVEKKKEYRRNRRSRLRHEASIIRAAKAAAAATTEPSSSSLNGSADSSVSHKLDDPPSQPAKDPAPNQVRQKDDERRRAQRLLLLLDIKEQRLKGTESTDSTEAIQRQRDQLLDVLKAHRHARPKVKNPPSAKESRSTRDTTGVARPDCTATSDASKPAPPVEPTASPDTLSFEALVTRRRAWDRFLVAPATPGASRIPAHFVVPPDPTPSSAWAVFAVSK